MAHTSVAQIRRRWTAGLLLVVAAGVVHAAPPPDNASRTPSGPERAQRNMDAPRNSDPEGEKFEKSAPARLSKPDRAFMTKAAGGLLFQQEAAKLGVERAQDPQLAALARTLQTDAASGLSGLQRVARDHNYPLPDAVPEGRRPLLARLGALSGEAFDSAFRLQVGIQDRRDDVRLYERALRTTVVPDFRAWLESRLPAERARLDAARQLEQQSMQR